MRCTRHLCRFVPELREYSVVVSRPRASAGCRGVRSRGAVTVGGRAVRNTGVGAPLSLLPVFRVVRCPGCRGAVVCVRRREAASGSCRLCFAAVGRSGARGRHPRAAAGRSVRRSFAGRSAVASAAGNTSSGRRFRSAMPSVPVVRYVGRRQGGSVRSSDLSRDAASEQDAAERSSLAAYCGAHRVRSRAYSREPVSLRACSASSPGCGASAPSLFQPGRVARDDADADRLDALRRTHGSDRQPIGAGAG